MEDKVIAWVVFKSVYGPGSQTKIVDFMPINRISIEIIPLMFFILFQVFNFFQLFSTFSMY